MVAHLGVDRTSVWGGTTKTGSMDRLAPLAAHSWLCVCWQRESLGNQRQTRCSSTQQDPEEHPLADIARQGRLFGADLAPEQWPAALVRPGQHGLNPKAVAGRLLHQ